MRKKWMAAVAALVLPWMGAHATVDEATAWVLAHMKPMAASTPAELTDARVV